MIYIADVSGHGITSSLLTIFLRQMVRGRVSDKQVDLKEVLGILQKSYNELGLDKEQYLTILFCVYDKEKKEVTFLNAGHNCLPIIISNSGEIREVEVKGLPVCALMKKSPHKEVTVPVEPGNRIILYTDGVSEACNENREPYGTERVLETLRDNVHMDGKGLAGKVISDAESFTRKPAADDMAIIIAKLL
jgi:sigma-B regulation protein RsbU (phosphoserine phosphatase)